jgi:mycothiol synthase
MPGPSVPDGYSLRNYRAGDEAAFVRVFNTAFGDHWDFVPLTEAEVAQWNRRPSFDPRGCFLLFEGDTLVGFATVLFNPERAEVTGKVVGRIFEMGVLPTYRRKGLGFILLQVALQYASQHGFAAVDLVTDAESEAGKQLYAKVGIEEKRSSLVLHRQV